MRIGQEGQASQSLGVATMSTAHDFLRPHVHANGMAQAEARLCEENELAKFNRHVAHSRIVDEYVLKHSSCWTSKWYQEWPVAEALAAKVHPRWELLKIAGNDALHEGRLEHAIMLYTDALTIADKNKGVAALFDALNAHMEDSAGYRLAALRSDLEPILCRHMPGPIGRHDVYEPNKPAAICLANRASALMKADRATDAVLDARAAVAACAGYVKGHHRLKQALLAAGLNEEAAVVDSQIRQYEALMKPCDSLMNVGFKLKCVGWLTGRDYIDVYEAPRNYHWLHAALDLSHYNAEDAQRPYHPGLRVHMEVFNVEHTPPGSQDARHYVASSLVVVPPRCDGRISSTDRAALDRMLPSIDYMYHTIGSGNRKVDGTRLYKRGSKSPLSHGWILASCLQYEIEKLPFLTSLSLGSPLDVHADEVRELLDEKGLLAPRLPGRELDGLDVCYTMGTCIKHKRFGYRGVIVGTADHTCTATDGWCEQMGVDQLRRGRYQSWYHVLVDVRDRPGAQRCYVCHDNLELWFPVGFDDDPLGPIQHPDVRRAFTAWHKERGNYVAPDLSGVL